MTIFWEGLFSGLSIGAVLLIAALGLAVVFGLMGAINLAHGELMMLGAYATFVVQNVFKALGDAWFDYYIIVALPAAFLVAALAGLVLERGVLRFLYGRPLETLLATWGISLILRQLVRSISGSLAIGIGLFTLLFFGGWMLASRRGDWRRWRGYALPGMGVVSGAIALGMGLVLQNSDRFARAWFSARNVDVTAPSWLRGAVTLGGVSFPAARLFIMVLTLVCTFGTYWFLYRSDWGLRIRAVTQNREMSACLGIPTARVDAMTFALGSGLAGIAGMAVSFLGSVGPNIGQNYIVDAFMVVVVGGVGNLFGSVLAALAIGSANYLVGSGILALVLPAGGALQPLIDVLNFFATASMAKVLVFASIVAFLQVRPSGIFPQKGRAANA